MSWSSLRISLNVSFLYSCGYLGCTMGSCFIVAKSCDVMGGLQPTRNVHWSLDMPPASKIPGTTKFTRKTGALNENISVFLHATMISLDTRPCLTLLVPTSI